VGTVLVLAAVGIFCFSMAVYSLFLLWHGWTTGEAWDFPENNPPISYPRRAKPIRYWLLMLTYAAIVGACLWAGYRCFYYLL
jgi:hypothetical protein